MYKGPMDKDNRAERGRIECGEGGKEGESNGGKRGSKKFILREINTHVNFHCGL